MNYSKIKGPFQTLGNKRHETLDVPSITSFDNTKGNLMQ
jgi:hypothetical protein